MNGEMVNYPLYAAPNAWPAARRNRLDVLWTRYCSRSRRVAMRGVDLGCSDRRRLIGVFTRRIERAEARSR